MADKAVKTKDSEQNSKSAPKKVKKIIRADRLEQCANAGKQEALKALVFEWRKMAQVLAAEQWDLYYREGRCNSKYVLKYPNSPLGGARVQMYRFQVVGILTGYLKSLAFQFKEVVASSTLSSNQKHKLYRINKAMAWNQQEPPTFEKPPFVDDEDMKLARRIFRRLLKVNRKPRFDNINAILDKRTVSSKKAKESQDWDYWLSVATLDKEGRGYRRVAVPLKSNPFAESRGGQHSTTWQMNIDGTGELHFARLTNVAKEFEQSKQSYQVKTTVLALDWGMNTLFASSEGDLVGRRFLHKLENLDKVICGIARHQQRKGLKPRDSQRYCDKITALRGYLKTEINRVINRLVATRAPGHLILEKLDFRNSQLSRRLNRLISNIGRSIIDVKLNDLKEKFGITSETINPAYTSQECNNPSCGYVDKNNRKGNKFQCRSCGKKQHADIKAAKTLKARCSSGSFSGLYGRAAILAVLVRQYNERFEAPRWKEALRTRSRGVALDPRLSNPYFKEWTAKVRLHHGPMLSF